MYFVLRLLVQLHSILSLIHNVYEFNDIFQPWYFIEMSKVTSYRLSTKRKFHKSMSRWLSVSTHIATVRWTMPEGPPGKSALNPNYTGPISTGVSSKWLLLLSCINGNERPRRSLVVMKIDLAHLKHANDASPTRCRGVQEILCG